MIAKILGLGTLLCILMCLGVYFAGIAGWFIVMLSFVVGVVAEALDEGHRNKKTVE